MGLRVNRQRFRITVNLSGLTWEDTTASERQDSNLRITVTLENTAVSIANEMHFNAVAFSSWLRSDFQDAIKGPID